MCYDSNIIYANHSKDYDIREGVRGRVFKRRPRENDLTKSLEIDNTVVRFHGVPNRKNSKYIKYIRFSL